MGEVRPKGLSLNFLEITHPRDIFDRVGAPFITTMYSENESY